MAQINMYNINSIIKQTIDIHMHIGPDIIPRKYTITELINAEKGKIAGFVLKNHFYPTYPLIKTITVKNLKCIGGIVLNNSIGGLNADAIYVAASISLQPIFVWLPTINAKNFLLKSKYEIAPEWVKQSEFKSKLSKNTQAVELFIKGLPDFKLTDILNAIRKTNSILATGHISWQESEQIVDIAIKLGLKKIVITHPIYQKIDMPIQTQLKLADKKCFIEHSYSMYSIDKIPIKFIAQQIKAIGYEAVILSSDMGQKFSMSPSKALYEFAFLLYKENIPIKGLYQMLVTNPRKLLNII